jgi:nucleoside-diphosphate-sugar epimerase
MDNQREVAKAGQKPFIIPTDAKILVTGAAGFIGSRVIKKLIDRGFRNIVCFTRNSSVSKRIEAIQKQAPAATHIEVFRGNLLRSADCEAACKDVQVVFHLAAGTGEKSFPDAFMNSVVATRNLLDACITHGQPRRFLLVSSFAVYTNCNKPHGRVLEESCPLEEHPEMRGDAYCFAKLKQEQLLTNYGREHDMPYVIVRPGSVYGEGNRAIVGRVGTSTFGLFLHIGGSNRIPFTYVENCADAIVLAGLVDGVDREIFNIVDDDLPTSRKFLTQYKKHVRNFKSVYVPHFASYLLCYVWEKYSVWSQGQLPLAFNRKRWHAYWKKTCYTNAKLKQRLGWAPSFSTAEGMRLYFQSLAKEGDNA